MKQLVKVLTLMSLISAASTSFAAPAASIEQLDWMTGNWAGNLGPNQLEEKIKILRSKGNTINAEMGMDLDMNKNLIKLLGKVEVLNSSGSTMNSYDLIVDQSDGGEVYKTSNSTHYQTQVSDIRARTMHYDAKTKKVELMGGVLGVYK